MNMTTIISACFLTFISGNIIAASVPPQGSELFKCQVHRGGGRDILPELASGVKARSVK